MIDSNKLQTIIYKLLIENLSSKLSDEDRLKWIKEALNYLKMFPPKDTFPQAEELSGILERYNRKHSVNLQTN